MACLPGPGVYGEEMSMCSQVPEPRSTSLHVCTEIGLATQYPHREGGQAHMDWTPEGMEWRWP